MIVKVVNDAGGVVEYYEAARITVEWKQDESNVGKGEVDCGPVYAKLVLDGNLERSVGVPTYLGFEAFVMNNDGKTVDVIR
tara:strand:- start:214 stop:456 length:243 start_codon:yes stop_codon:yes gene_type:complete